MRSSSETLVTRLTMEVAVALFTAAIGAIAVFGSVGDGIGWDEAGPQSGYFPFYIGLIVIVASLGALVQAVIKHRDRKAVFLTREQGQRVLSFSLPMAAFVLVANFLGLYVGLLLYLFGAMVFQGGYRPLKAGAISVVSVLIFYVVFEIWFQVPLLKGPVEAWLKLH